LESGGTCKVRPGPPQNLSGLTGFERICHVRRAALDREHLDRRGAPAQRRRPQRLNDKIAAGTHQAQQIAGNQQPATGLLVIRASLLRRTANISRDQ
jgi:hypothetical protein